MAGNLAPSSSSVPGSPTEGTVDACPFIYTPELTAGKWALHIFPVPENDPACNNKFLRHVGNGISQKVLMQTPRGLEVSGLILCTIYSSVPPHVEYRLNPLGELFNRTLVGLDDWVRAYWSDIERIRKGQVDSD